MSEGRINRRNVVVAVSLVLLAVFGFLGANCSKISTWTTALLVIGLLFDGAGALIIVGPELSNLEQYWQNTDTAELVSNLKEGQDTLFEDGQLNTQDTGFKEASETIMANANGYSTPDGIEKSGMWDGGDEVQFIYDDDENENIGSPQIVNEWLNERIDQLEERARKRMISDGAKVLAVGFGFQLAGTAIQRIGPLGDALISISPC